MRTINATDIIVNNILVAAWNGDPCNVADANAYDAIADDLAKSDNGLVTVLTSEDEDFITEAEKLDYTGVLPKAIYVVYVDGAQRLSFAYKFFDTNVKYNILRSINGHDNGTILCTCNTKTEAQEQLQHYMSLLDNGGDDTYIGDEDARQNIIGMLNDIAEADGADVSADIAKVNSWSVPCIINQPSLNEVCNTNGDSFCYDSVTYEIAEAKPTIKTLNQLADYINDYAERNPEDGWDHETVDSAIAANGWFVGDNDFEVCKNGKEKVIIDDKGFAIVIDCLDEDE